MNASNEVLLRRPLPSDLPDIYAYRAEFLQNGDSMDGTSRLRRYENMNEWLDQVRRDSTRETCRPDWVPQTQYLIIRQSDQRLVGMLHIHHELNEECLRIYGHIGYSVRKSERGHGYAAAALSLALDICRDMGIERVLLTCDRENIASAKTILQCGGVLENEIFDPDDGTMVQRYWIHAR